MPRLLNRDYSWALSSDAAISDYIRIPNYDPTGSSGRYLTVASWGKSSNGIFSHNTISQFDYGNNQRSWHLAIQDGRMRVTLSANGSGLTKRYDSAAQNLDNNEWHLYGMSWDGDTQDLQFKLDNEDDIPTVKPLDTAMTNLHPSTADLMIGSILQNNSPRSD